MSDLAYLPKRRNDGSPGYDLYSSYNVIIPAKEHKLINTDLSVGITTNCYGRIAPRSGLKYKISVGGGVVDPDNRGYIGIILFNLSDDDFHIHKGERITQLILEQHSTPEMYAVKELEETTRGQGGFGSTGNGFSFLSQIFI